MDKVNLSCETCPFSGAMGVEIECHHAEGMHDLSGSGWWCDKHPLAPGQRDRIAERMYAAAVSSGESPGSEDPIKGVLVISYAIADVIMSARAKGCK